MPPSVTCLLLAAWLLAPPPAPPGARALAGCERVALSAERAVCTGGGCSLDGNARLRCGERWLHAEHIDVFCDGNRVLQRVHARGQVLVVDSTQLLQAEHAELGGDLQQGSIAHAQLAQFVATGTGGTQLVATGPGSNAEDLLPRGRRAVSFAGSLERLPSRAWRVRGAQVTLCDCGPQTLPSWRLDAPRMYVNAQASRTLALWPVLRLHLWPGRMVPVTPPLPPISLPLRRRALGLLPPRLQFLTPRLPTLDLPMFVPLGESWDVTLTPGVRLDWAAAPRFAARVRGRPSRFATLQSEFALTYDRRGLEGHLVAMGLAGPQQRQVPGNIEAARARAALRARLLVLHQHDWAQVDLAAFRAASSLPSLRQSLRWTANIAWAGDDDVLRDLAVAPAERAATYLPSRSVLSAADGWRYLQLSAEFMQRLDSMRSGSNGALLPDPRNTAGAERSTVHRLPALQASMPHRTLRGPLDVDATGAYTLLTRLPGRGGAPVQPALSAPLHVLASSVGTSARGTRGPVHLGLRLGLDAVAGVAHLQPAVVAITPILRAEARLPLARRYGRHVHTLEPAIVLLGTRALRPPWAADAQLPVVARALDEHFWRQNVAQIAVALRQALWRQGPTYLPAMRLDVWLPMALTRPALLRPNAELDLDFARLGSLRTYVGLDLQALHRGAATSAVQELAIDYSRNVRSWLFSANYLRMAPNAERLQRSLYVLAAPNLDAAARASRDAWQHTLRLGLAHAPATGMRVAYAGGLQLPRQNGTGSYAEPACAGGRGIAGRRACFTSHMLALGYASACNCWRVDATLSAAPQNFLGTFRFLVVLDIAGYRVGSPG